MEQASEVGPLGRSVKLRLLAILLGLSASCSAVAQPAWSEPAEPSQPPDVRNTFVIKDTTTFACAEVAMERTGGQARHEISLGPRWIQRCLLQKVGTRLHECIRLKVEKATADQDGVVRVETDQGDVSFWFEEGAKISSTKEAQISAAIEGEGALSFTFPDNEKRKYICAPFR